MRGYEPFPETGLKVPYSCLAPKRKYGIFGLDVRKNNHGSRISKKMLPFWALFLPLLREASPDARNLRFSIHFST